MRVAFFGHVDNNNEKKIFDIFVYLGFQFRPTSIQHYFFMDFQKDDKKWKSFADKISFGLWVLFVHDYYFYFIIIIISLHIHKQKVVH